MSSVIFVRHAMPLSAGDQDPSGWHLGADALQAAELLAERLDLPDDTCGVLSSSEPKAVETAAPIAARLGGEPWLDDRLREARRRWIGPGYRGVAHRYLRGEVPHGWEPQSSVTQRVGAAIADAPATGTIVVVTHGMALSLYLAERLGAGFVPEHFWSRLAFPDAWTIDCGGTLHRPLHPARTGR